jgi:RHS repeat-associated protein
MKTLIQYITSLLLLASSVAGYSQQVAVPGNNTYTGIDSVAYAQVPYPGLADLSGVTKFNFIRSILPDQPVQSTAGTFYMRQNTDYFDGLGRPLQSVARKAHPSGYDLVQHHVYDSLGRERYQYLPFAVTVPFSNGKIKKDAYTKLRGFYDAAGNDEQPYSRTDFEASSLGRPLKQLSPGRSWVGVERGQEISYATNTTWKYVTTGAPIGGYPVTGAYPRWSITNTKGAIPVWEGDYAINELYQTWTKDEDGNNVMEYKDKQDKVVIRMQSLTGKDILNSVPADFAYTCYVYDDLGRLRCVIPPKACAPSGGVTSNFQYSFSLNQDKLDNLCYQYFYDYRGRMVEKSIPGKGTEYLVYDLRDRLCLSRDAKLRSQGQWAFTLYDALNRPTVTGIITTLETREQLQSAVNDAYPYYTHDAMMYHINNYNSWHDYPTSLYLCTILTYTYYDSYERLTGFSYDPSQFVGQQPAAQAYLVTAPQTAATLTRGQVTGSAVRVRHPEDATMNNWWLTTANYYDDKGRLIQSQSGNIRGGKDITSTIYYFQGMPWKTITDHVNPTAKAVPNATDGAITEQRLVTTYERKLGNTGGSDQVVKVNQQIGNGPVFNLANYGYDHLGRVTLKDMRAGMVKQDYTIHGFLNQIDAEHHSGGTETKLFKENLYYDKGFASKLYNGNIAGIIWSGADGKQNAYGYSYDKLSRLTHAEYRRKDSVGLWKKNVKDYTASNISYDLNGNLMTMDQQGVVPNSSAIVDMDHLVYTYAANSNRLKTVEDDGQVIAALPDFKNGASMAEEYQYDLNGNMTRDENKKIRSISYNYLNKPEIITTDSGSIAYVYDATGNRLQKLIHEGSNTVVYDYISNFVYKDSVLQYILNEEGRARPVANDSTQHTTRFVYDYFIKDHLGNVRSTVTAQPINAAYLAGHEISMANVEQLIFDNIPNVRDGKPGTINPNDGMAAGLVAELADKRIGTAVLLKVMPGDRFTIDAQSYYEDEYTGTETIGNNDIISSLMSVLGGGSTYAGVPINELSENARTIKLIFEAPNLAEKLNTIVPSNYNAAAPKAHLNYLFFDDNLQLVADLSGKIQVSPNGAGTSGWQTVGTGTEICNCTAVAPGSSGYIAIYVDNQSLGKKVWFDDLHIEHYTSEVLEEDHYYPFGLTVQLDQNTSVQTKQPYKLTGKELEKTFDLNYYDFGARMQDMTIGRWWGVDPFAEKHYSMSPYVYVGNNPIKFVDLDGRDYGVHFSDKTVTISATYYTNSSSVGDAQQSATRINQQGNKYVYTVGEGENMKTYDVVFDVKVVNVEDDPDYKGRSSISMAIIKDNSGEANMYLVVGENEISKDRNGQTDDGNKIRVRKSREGTETGAHEIGHTLGMVHGSKGLLTKSPDKGKERKDTDLKTNDIQEEISFPLKGKVNYEYDDNHQKIEAGQGTIHNTSSQTIDQLKKGKVSPKK